MVLTLNEVFLYFDILMLLVVLTPKPSVSILFVLGIIDGVEFISCCKYASIMALKAYKSGSTDVVDGYFTVEDYDSWSYSSNNILHVYGGIIQGYRGPVGTFDGSTPSTGFTKDYQYDNRFSFVAPPNFPTTGNYITYFSKYISKSNVF